MPGLTQAEMSPTAQMAAAGCVAVVLPPSGDSSPPRAGKLRRAMRRIGSAAEWMFGLLSLIVALAVLATLPVLQFLSLGYLLEVGGRVVRARRLTSGLVGVRKAARLGGIVLGAWLVLLPLRFFSLMVNSSRLIAPDSPADRGWTLALWILTPLAVAHLVGALLRGGRLRHFLWPRPIRLARQLAAPGAYAAARDAVWDYVVGLRLPYYFWLGVRGFVGGLIWLAIPVTLMAAGQTAPVMGLVGGLLLSVVVMYLPFAQVQLAAQGRFRALVRLRLVRDHFRHAPWAFLIALVCTLSFAVPLYLLKIEILPREAAWLPSVLFVGFAFPARLLTGWAYARADRHQLLVPVRPRHWFFRHSARLAMLPVAALYVVIVYFTQFTSWHGMASLYEQHAFLLPVPFVGL
jgi:hypothetical protein